MRQISEYVFPQRGLFNIDGEKPHTKEDRYSKIIDPVATEDNEMLASGTQGGLSSPSQPWFKLEPINKNMLDMESVAAWCYYVQNQMYSVLSSSNFYNTIHSHYEDNSAFGNAVTYCEEDPKALVRFKCCPPGEYCFAESKSGRVDTLYRRIWMTGRQILNRWPQTASDEIRNAKDKKEQQWFEVVHVIEPNDGRDTTKIDSRNMPFKSVYFEYQKTDRILSSGGYMELPFAAGRWSVNGSEVYGHGPGHMALNIVKMLQSMQKTSLKAHHQESDPALLVPMQLKDKVNSLPGGINYTPSADNRDVVKRLFDMRFDYQAAELKIERIKEAIHSIFKRDLFLLIADRPEMTATEVVERSQEKIILIGPVIERYIHEVLNPLLERVFQIMNRAGAIPPPPFELMGQSLKIEYISVLAQAQKMIGLQNMRSYLDAATAVAAINPMSVEKTDWDQFMQETADRLAIAPNITLPDEIVAARREQAAQMQQMMAEMEMLKQGGEAARSFADAANKTGEAK